MALIKTIKQEEADGRVKELYEPIVKLIGRVIKPVEMASVSPDLLALQVEYLEYYNIGQRSLSFKLLAFIRLLVADDHNFNFCINFNSTLLKKLGGVEKDLIRAARENPEDAPLDEKEKAMLLFVLKAVKSPELVEKGDLDSLRDLGWNDREIFDAVVHGGYMVMLGIAYTTFKMDED